MYPDMLKEPRQDKKLLKHNPEQMVSPLSYLHQILLMSKQKQPKLQTLLLKELPNTSLNTEMKKLPTTYPNIELEKVPTSYPNTKLKKLPTMYPN